MYDHPPVFAWRDLAGFHIGRIVESARLDNSDDGQMVNWLFLERGMQIRQARKRKVEECFALRSWNRAKDW